MVLRSGMGIMCGGRAGDCVVFHMQESVFVFPRVATPSWAESGGSHI